MLRRDRHHVPKTQPPEVLCLHPHLRRIHLVHRQKAWLSPAQKQPRQLQIRRCQLRPPIDHHDNRIRLLKRHLRLPEDLTGNQRLIIRHHAARIHNPHIPPAPLHLPVDPVPRNSRFIAHNRTPRPRQPVEQCRLPNVRSSAYRHQRQCRILLQLRINAQRSTFPPQPRPARPTSQLDRQLLPDSLRLPPLLLIHIDRLLRTLRDPPASPPDALPLSSRPSPVRNGPFAFKLRRPSRRLRLPLGLRLLRRDLLPSLWSHRPRHRLRPGSLALLRPRTRLPVLLS